MVTAFVAKVKKFLEAKPKPKRLEKFRTIFKQANHEIAFRDGVDEFIDEAFQCYKTNGFFMKSRFQEHPVQFAGAVAEVFSVSENKRKELEAEDKLVAMQERKLVVVK